LKPRVANVSVTIGQAIVSATPATGGRLRVKLDDGSERTVDHVLMGTGYRVDITKYPFLSKKLLASIRHVGGYPQLNAGFESSVAGLHFLGAPAAWSFGPLMRFVAGADFATRSLARGVARNN
jgi:hypothetical protein